LISGFAAIVIIVLILVFVIDFNNLTSPFKSITEAEKVEEAETGDGKESTGETATEKESEGEETVITDTSSGKFLIVFCSQPGGGDSEIYVMNSDGSNKVQLTDNDLRDSCASWSPDGSKIVFKADQGMEGDIEIWIMDPDGSNQIQLTDNDIWDGGFLRGPETKN